uniref:(California timema) hypothetical protein n=1 Tax=Timema californicum TaxID=61474 RepID=A0A7R9J8R3_TIMCA|nr:unnamed protein product [Timema californicum]
MLKHSILWESVRDYLDHSSIHGFKFLTQEGRHWVERVFWLSACVAAAYGSSQLLLASWYAFQHNAISFTPETTYLDWKTGFPAVTVCEDDSRIKTWAYATRRYGTNMNGDTVKYLREIAFFKGFCTSCRINCNKKNAFCPMNVDDIVAEVFLHSPEDVPYYGHDNSEMATVEPGKKLNIKFQVKEIMNDPMLDEVSLEQRGCRFTTENPHRAYPYYSATACIIECQALAQLELCNCTHHFTTSSFGGNRCNLRGLSCLTEFADTIGNQKPEGSTDMDGLVCHCLPSCSEPEYTIVFNNISLLEDYKFQNSKVYLQMESLPTERFKRNVVRTKLDLVVSMGGTAGLFLGASLLSFIEFIMYFCVRVCSRSQHKKSTGEY